VFKRNNLWIAAVAMAGAVLVSAAIILGWPTVMRAQAQGEQSTWVPAPGVLAPYDSANAIFMTGVNSAWLAVDESGAGVVYYIEWQNDRWARTYASPGFRCPLRGISAISNENVWAVGDCGLILHGTHSGWEEVPNPLPNPNLQANLYAIQMLGDGSEGWAGGVLPNPNDPSAPVPILLHYANHKWTQDPSITGNGTITSLHFISSGSGWAAVGSAIWHYQNGKWTQESLPPPCNQPGCFIDIGGIRALSDYDAWAVGDVIGLCGICVSKPYAIYRNYNGWQPALPPEQIFGLDMHPSNSYYLKSVYFTDGGYGLMVGGYIPHNDNPEGIPRPIVLSIIQGQIINERPPDVAGDLNAVAAYEPGYALAVGSHGLILSNGYGFVHAPGPIPTAMQPFYTATATPTPLPSEPIPDPHRTDVTYFPITGHTLWGGFRDYWNAHGGLEQFGYPITEEFQEVSPTDGKLYTTQYFERARFEWHPENKPPYDVLLGLLGRTITKGRENEQPFLPTPAQASPGSIYFEATHHNMAPELAQYWQEYGGLPVYGYPISEPFMEVSQADGKPYLVQYFERNRLEYHPELPEAYRVSLGLLGTEVLRARGWIE
jgi:hypothetical protein